LPGPAGISEYGSQDAAVGETSSHTIGTSTAAKLGRWTTDLDELLARNETKAAREQLTLIRIFEELRGRGYEGGYDAVRRYARTVEQGTRALDGGGLCPAELRAGGSLPVRLEPRGRPAEWRDGDREGRHVRLCHSRMLFVRVYPRETQEMVFECPRPAFALFKGACGRGIYDNMRRLWRRSSSASNAFTIAASCKMCSHYLVDPVACTPASGWEKGQVENQVGLVRERFFTPRLRFKNLDEVERLATRPMHRLRQGAPPSGADRIRRSASVRGGTAELVPYAGGRRLHAGVGVGLEDLLGSLGQYKYGGSQRGRASVEVTPMPTAL